MPAALSSMNPFLIVAFCALPWLLFWSFAGFKYFERRLLWGYADLFWILVGSATAITTAYSIAADEHQADEQVIHSGEKVHRFNIHLATWSLEDKHCLDLGRQTGKQKSSANTAKSVCSLVSSVKRDLALPDFNNVSADRLLNDVRKRCTGNLCKGSDLELLEQRLEEYKHYYDKFRATIEKNIAANNGEKLPWKVFALSAFLCVFGPRIGRTIAELRRESRNNPIVSATPNMAHAGTAHQKDNLSGQENPNTQLHESEPGMPGSASDIKSSEAA